MEVSCAVVAAVRGFSVRRPGRNVWLTRRHRHTGFSAFFTIVSPCCRGSKAPRGRGLRACCASRELNPS